MPDGRRTRGVTPVRGQGRSPGGATPRPRSGQQPREATPCPRLRVAAERSYPTSEDRGSGWEELPHAQGQGWQLGGATPCPRSGGCMGAGGPREAIPHSRSEGVVVRRYPSSKVRSSGCALLEQRWRYPTSKVRETQVRW